MHAKHVLFIVELQIQILSFLNARCLLQAALVCKQWSEVALDLLWHVLHDLHPLISLLAPVVTKRKFTLQGARFFVVSYLMLSTASC